MAKSILIVDNDPVQRRLLGEIVTAAGFRPVPVDGGRSALARLAERGDGDIDLVLLDLQMPDIDGIGVLERIKPDSAGVPVIVITAHAGIDHAVRAMRAGATDFVVKPVSTERLQASMRKALQITAGEDKRPQRADALAPNDIVGASPALRKVLAPPPAERPESPDAAPSAPRSDDIPLLNDAGDVRPLGEIEAEVIRRAIDHYDGQMSKVARRLGIGRSTLYRKVRELGYEPV